MKLLFKPEWSIIDCVLFAIAIAITSVFDFHWVLHIIVSALFGLAIGFFSAWTQHKAGYI